MHLRVLHYDATGTEIPLGALSTGVLPNWTSPTTKRKAGKLAEPHAMTLRRAAVRQDLLRVLAGAERRKCLPAFLGIAYVACATRETPMPKGTPWRAPVVEFYPYQASFAVYSPKPNSLFISDLAAPKLGLLRWLLRQRMRDALLDSKWTDRWSVK